MSVFIPGFEMPRDCFHCPFEMFLSDKKSHCRANRGREIQLDIFGKGQNCPLVEIKTPHGRLIDADANVAVMEKCKSTESAFERSFYSFAAQIMRECPTIIEAEGGGEDG